MTRILLTLAVALVVLAAACTTEEPRTAAPAPPADPADRTGQAQSAPPQDRQSAAPAPRPEGPAEPAPAQPRPAAQPPSLAADPEGLARQITDAEQTIRSDAGDAQIAEAALVQQAAYRRLARDTEERDAVLAHMPADLHDIVVTHVDAATDLGALVTPRPQLPRWRIVAPPPAEELLASYREAQEVFGVGWEYLAAIHLVETRMGRIRGTSSAGAQGPMQFMPATWAAYGQGDINDSRDAILAAGRYLSANGAPATMGRALYAYNHSDAYVRAVTAHAEQMRADPRVFRGYYHWQVYYRHVDGDQLLPVGYDGAS